MAKLIILKGLPGSGKTTWAREQKGYKRVNKDDLRAMLDNSVHTKSNEKFLLKVRDFIVRLALQERVNIICDDTNFNPVHEKTLREIAKANGSLVEVKEFDTSIEECIERDAKRLNPVGEAVIRGMANQYSVPQKYDNPEHLPRAVICDIDGTISEGRHRSPYDWAKVGGDEPIKKVIDVVTTVARGKHLIFLSGRDSVCANQTATWITEHFPDLKLFESTHLYMRQEGDMRKDYIVKNELFDQYVRGKYHVDCVFDDRDQVVKLWRDLGLQCFQCNYGNF
ncbi:MAG: AAA family ATPase [Candidatus Moraniibacteriota bacterium]